MANLSGRLPDGDRNGLHAIAAELVECPEKVHVALVLIDTKKVTRDVDTGAYVATVRVRRIEVITGRADGDIMRRVLHREWERRTGKAVLPFELEEELRQVLDDPPSGKD